MKSFKIVGLIIIILGLSWAFISFGENRQINESLELDSIQELSYSGDLNASEILTEQNMQEIGFRLYVEQLRETHLDLKESRESVNALVDEIKLMRLELVENNIQLSENDRLSIRESYIQLRFHRYILEETLGQGYQQLSNLKENTDQYTQDQAKLILIDVYLTLNSRIKVFEDINFQLLAIKGILEKY